LLGALIAALSFDFFFTEPYLRLVIDDTHDIITTVLLFAAGIGTAELGSLRVKRALRQHPSPPAASGG
jgi:K+-sensing histidine kinase KdpD